MGLTSRCRCRSTWDHTGTGEPEFVVVRFRKGAQSRSMEEERITNVSKAATLATVRYILAHFGEVRGCPLSVVSSRVGDMLVGWSAVWLLPQSAKEMLKPHLMAQCSPRVFWSLVRYGGGNVEAALKQLIPGAVPCGCVAVCGSVVVFVAADVCVSCTWSSPEQDWSFLSHRARTLSRKALENARQAHEAHMRKEERRRLREAKAASRKHKQQRAHAPALRPADGSTGQDSAPAVAAAPATAASGDAPAGDASHSDALAALGVTVAQLVQGETHADLTAQENCVTVLCDTCHKARFVLEPELTADGGDGGGDDDAPWYCSSVPRIGACTAPDDEVQALVGCAAARVLASHAVVTRRQLADASVGVDEGAMATALAAAPHPTLLRSIASAAVVCAASEVLVAHLSPDDASAQRLALAKATGADSAADAVALSWIQAAREAELEDMMPMLVPDSGARAALSSCGVETPGEFV